MSNIKEKDRIRSIAIYLPQFHPIPENDQWWGKGFTEWTNVTKTTPRFKGHYQPHLPADLGFYDLRVPEVREAQAAMAKKYAIDGFCYYHYWFNGRRVLERPFNEVLKSGKPDFPFCLCWANENWNRRWDGTENEILLEQNYSLKDDEKHMDYLCEVFRDKRYIRIDNKPLFIVYKTDLMPDIKKTAEVWRERARKNGIGEIYLARMESLSSIPPAEIGFDAAIEFQPDWHNLPPRLNGNLLQKILNKLNIKRSPFVKDRVVTYSMMVEKMMQKKYAHKTFPSITPGWDNSPRRKEKAIIVNGSTPGLYEKWLKHIKKHFKPFSKEENFIFINAWNEWAEGNHLEPCQKWGKAYLEKHKAVMDSE